MPSSIEKFEFSRSTIDQWARKDPRHTNWPVVYVLEEQEDSTQRRNRPLRDVYVGETLNAASRMRQHLGAASKRTLSTAHVIVDPTFNKSACLDLESHLIGLLAGDGSYQVLNRNDGITSSEYFDRPSYRKSFRETFEKLRADGVFTRSLPAIENSALFKLSPYKALNEDQAIAVEDILEGLFTDLETGRGSSTVIEGAPGTGKTIVAIYLLKLLADIQATTATDDLDPDSRFAEYFTEGYPDLLRGMRIGFVIPQQSLRDSVQNVFRKTPGLRPEMVMTAFQAGEADGQFDLLVVDEAHRLNKRANQPTGSLNAKFRTITTALFGQDDVTKTQLDWIRAKSQHQILLIDADQSVRPADLSPVTVQETIRTAHAQSRHYPLRSQMRVAAGSDYVAYIRRILLPPASDLYNKVTPFEPFDGYDFRLFDDPGDMHAAIRAREAEAGLARMVAGYAWKWSSRSDKTAFDITIGDYQARWNGTQVDWIASSAAIDEVGSIHTVQGYDLNYAGVIIGPDLKYDESAGRLIVDRSSYFDAKGTENNRALGITYSDDDILRFIRNIYGVLLTRGILGTYVYVCDPPLRRYLSQFIPRALEL